MAFDLTKKEFIETLLKTPVKSFTIGEGCKKGDNVAGSLQSIVATTASGETISAVYKSFPPKESHMYQHIKESGVFRTECDAYTVIYKDIEKLVNSRRVSNSNNSSSDTAATGTGTKNTYVAPLPSLYNHFNDDENDYLCLEDVRSQGFIMPNVFNGLTYPETSLILQELAAFHAYTYALLRLEGEQLMAGKWSRFDFSSKLDSMTEWFGVIRGCVETSIEIIQKVNPSVGQKMLEGIPPEKTGDLMGSFNALTNTKLFPCIVHGDFWSNNVLIKYDGKSDADNRAKKPIAVKFVDFQYTRHGNIFEDLVYFLFTSTDTAFRGKYLTRVLVDYHGSFKNALESIKFPMPINFTPGLLIDTFNSLAKAGLVHMCFAIPFQLGKHSEPEPEPQPDPAGATPSGPELKGDQINEPSAVDPVAMQKAMMRKMVESSPPALKRLEEITQEILVSGRY